MEQAQKWKSRRHCFAAAEAMRRIPLENAGRKGRARRRARARGGGDLPTPERPERLLALDEALDRVEAANPQAASW
jgi:hypothetical protein